MCGIAGVVRHGGAVGADPAAALDAALAHRGPDGSGAWRSPAGDALLVHRRLAIIDPGPSGAQPMATPDGRHLLVFNGEVYNYRELRRSLEGRGERLHHRQRHRGAAAAAGVRRPGRAGRCSRHVRARLVGRRERDAARRARSVRHQAAVRRGARRVDRVRIRDSGARLIGARRAHDRSGRRARLPRLGQHAAAADLASPASRAWRRGPGRAGARTAAACSVRFADVASVYAAADARARPNRSCASGSARRCRTASRAHLVADVPVGIFLSGGIDSSAILSAAVNAGAASLNTYTVRFDDRSSRARVRAARRVDVRRDASRAASSTRGESSPICRASSAVSISRHSTP